MKRQKKCCFFLPLFYIFSIISKKYIYINYLFFLLCLNNIHKTCFHFLKVYTKHGLFTWYIWSIHIGLLYNHVLQTDYIIEQICRKFIQIQILIGFQPNRFVTKYSQKTPLPKFMEQIKSMLFVFRSFCGHYVNLDCLGVLHIILKMGHPKIISTQISEQNILMQFLSHNIPKWNKLAEKISQKNSLLYSCS